jgi:hypothetical protein
MTDQPLHLDGLELICDQTSGSQIGTAHLVYVEKAPLTLTNCIIRAPLGQACVVCRECPKVYLDTCQITADSLAVCIETGARETDLGLNNSRLQTESPRGAALSFWASEAGRNGTFRVHVDDCTIQTGRAFAFGVLPKQISVSAKNNHITFREALVSFTHSPTPGEWRRVTQWADAGNYYETSGTEWLQVNGISSDVHDQRAWQKLWSTP